MSSQDIASGEKPAAGMATEMAPKPAAIGGPASSVEPVASKERAATLAHAAQPEPSVAPVACAEPAVDLQPAAELESSSCEKPVASIKHRRWRKLQACNGWPAWRQRRNQLQAWIQWHSWNQHQAMSHQTGVETASGGFTPSTSCEFCDTTACKTCCEQVGCMCDLQAWLHHVPFAWVTQAWLHPL